MQGYLEGDGQFRRGKFYGFSTNSQVLAMGVEYLVLKNKIADDVHVYCRDDKPDDINIHWFENGYSRGTSPRTIKKVSILPYEGYIYDLTTANHSFCTGVGPIEAHNTAFQLKLEKGKLTREEPCNVLALPFFDRFPARKGRI